MKKHLLLVCILSAGSIVAMGGDERRPFVQIPLYYVEAAETPLVRRGYEDSQAMGYSIGGILSAVVSVSTAGSYALGWWGDSADPFTMTCISGTSAAAAVLCCFCANLRSRELKPRG